MFPVVCLVMGPSDMLELTKTSGIGFFVGVCGFVGCMGGPS